MLATAPPPIYGPDPGNVDRYEAAQAAVRRFCGWHVAPVIEQTFTVDGPGGHVLALPTLRLVDVLAVSQDGVEFTADEIAAMDWSHDGYIRAPLQVMDWPDDWRWHPGRWTKRLRGVQVTIVHGFESTPELEALIADLASRATTGVVVRKQIGNRSVEFTPPGLLQHEKDMLAKYRLPSMG
jgi:hypothetical protein